MLPSFIVGFPVRECRFLSPHTRALSRCPQIAIRPKNSSLSCLTPRASAQSSQPRQTLYQILGITDTADPKTLSVDQIRRAYLKKAKQNHPDANPTNPSASADFDTIAYAWSILSDAALRKVYDTSGQPGLDAVQSIEQRSNDVKERYSHMSGEQLDFLSDTGQLIGSLLTTAPPSPVAAGDDASTPPDHDDACPRSIEEAIWNIENHEDPSVRYYTLWWIYRFKVTEAEDALVKVLQTSQEKTSSGGYTLRRRAALALGAVAKQPSKGSTTTIEALENAFNTDDYFLRYRAAEALANIAYRAQNATMQSGTSEPEVSFPESMVKALMRTLEKGRDGIEAMEEGKTGYTSQEGMFNMDGLDPEVRKKLEVIFAQRMENERRSRRTTMTPQLGVARVGTEMDDEPYEWIIKAVSAILSLSDRGVIPSEYVETINTFAQHDVPLVRYAARKALFSLTGEEHHADDILQALRYGIEHHYSQRVLIRDLGDVGFWQGAKAVAQCPMVENSFKILALKNMLVKLQYDAKRPEVKQVLEHMDSLL